MAGLSARSSGTGLPSVTSSWTRLSGTNGDAVTARGVVISNTAAYGVKQTNKHNVLKVTVYT